MNILDAKNKIISYFLKNKDVGALIVPSEGLLQKIGIEEGDVNEAIVKLAFDSLTESKIFLKLKMTNKAHGESAFSTSLDETATYALAYPLHSQPQDVDVSFPVAEAIEKTIKQYCEATGSNYTIDKANISEQDIATLLVIISELSEEIIKKQD